MLKAYSIHDLLSLPSQYIPYYAGTFEDTEDIEAEWPHRHTFYSMVWFTQGSGFYVIDFQEYEIQPNRLFFVNPKQVHNWNYSENSEGFVLVIDGLLEKKLNIHSQFPFVDLDNTISQYMKPIFENLISEYEARKPIETDIEYLYKIVERYATKNSTKRSQPNLQFDKFKGLILKSLDKNYSTEEYAEKLNLSTDELNTICKQITGYSAKQYILDLKITEAKRCLIYTRQNINEIAYQLGFEDSSYFTRLFKKKTSLSPSIFIEKYRK